jgi:membrane fusion protein, multidrug efflux system
MKTARLAMPTATRPPLLRFAAALALIGLGAVRAAEAPLNVVTVTYETAPRERVWDGTIDAVNRATVSAQTSGRVAEIYYDVDNFVPAGAPIMRFTDVEQRAALNSARAALDETEARATEADAELKRVSSMFDNGTVSKARFEQARANAEAAKARLESARAGVKHAEEQLEYTIVRAPYAGIVSQRHVEVGEVVRPGAPLMSGLSLEHLRVNVDVPQSMLDPIRRIGKANVYVDDRAIPAESLTFFPVATQGTNTFRVRVTLPAGAATLYPGTFVKVGFIVGDAERLLVPTSAIVRRSELTAVYVVGTDAVTLRQIRIGRRYGERTEVLAGLAAGESIATDPVAAGQYLEKQR